MATRQKTLLCVDDNQSSLKICKMVLEDVGYKILTSSSAREGLDFGSNAIDAVILDYQTPEMNGELVAVNGRIREFPFSRFPAGCHRQKARCNQWTNLSPKEIQSSSCS